MTDPDAALDLVRRTAAELIPELTERLARHGLGEIEVAHGELRLRVTAPPSTTAPGAAPAAASGAASAAPTPTPSAPAGDDPAPRPHVGVPAPAVGFFVYADGLGPGLAVTKGDPIGHVEMLGIRHDVRVPRAGTVRNLVAESGEAVEYGQVVVELEPGGDGR